MRHEHSPSSPVARARADLLDAPTERRLAEYLEQPVADPATWRRELTTIWANAYPDRTPADGDWSHYVGGIAKLGRAAQRLVPGVLSAITPDEIGTNPVREGMVAVFSAGARAQVEQAALLLPRIGTHDPDAAVMIGSELVNVIDRRLAEAPRDRPWLTSAMGAQSDWRAPLGDRARNLVADYVLAAALGSEHPGAVAFVRAAAQGSFPSGQTFSSSWVGRRTLVVSWCERRIADGRAYRLAQDQVLVPALTNLALTGRLPNDDWSVDAEIQAHAAAVMGVVSDAR
jgi:hypothetical protein